MSAFCVPKEQMRAYRANVGAQNAKLETVDIPKIGPQDVLIKVVSAGLAPGVFFLLKAGMLSQLPTTFGHEVAGVVAETGDLVKTVEVGQRVRLHPNVSCGVCNFCSTGRDQMCVEAGIIGLCGFSTDRMPLFERYHEGGLADFIRAPSWLVDVLPDNVNFDVGAKIHDLANAMRVLKVAQLPPGAAVVITAPTGSMGTSCVKLAPFFGIARLILVGRSTSRLEAVNKICSTAISCEVVGFDSLGADWAESKALIRRLLELSPQRRVDAIIDFMPTGTDHFQMMGVLAADGAFVHMAGSRSVLPVPLIAMMRSCWRIIGTKNHARGDAKTVLQWLQDGRLKVDDLITHNFTLDAVDEAVRELHSRSSPVWMMVVNP